MKDYDIKKLLDESRKKHGDPVLFVDLEREWGYLIYYSGPKGIQVKRGIFEYRYWIKDKHVTTNFYPCEEKNNMLIHEEVRPLIILKNGKVMVKHKKDIDKGISILKEYLKERYEATKKEYEERLNRFKNAIENEVIYEC